MRQRLAFILAAFIAVIALSAASSAETLQIPREVDGRSLTLSGDFEKPPGAGPFAVVVVLHTCAGLADGPKRGLQPWLELFHQQGYATLLLDSFTPRGVPSVCGDGRIVSGGERAKDLLEAAYVLAGRSDVKADKIGAIGYSHGGWTAVYAATAHPDLQPWRDKLATRGKLAAAVGLYPNCRESIGVAAAAPLLVLIGEKDDWTPAPACVSLGESAKAAGWPVRVKVYPDALHGFDVNKPPASFGAHHMAYNAAADEDSRAEVTRFFAQYLK
jgi:dienelactone hydrolase